MNAVEFMRLPLDAASDRTSVYVALDHADTVLYVGVTANGTQRFTQHAAGNPHWWLETERLIVLDFACRHDALNVEAFLIQALNPEWNTARPMRDQQRGCLLAMQRRLEDDFAALAFYA